MLKGTRSSINLAMEASDNEDATGDEAKGESSSDDSSSDSETVHRQRRRWGVKKATLGEKGQY